MDEFPDHLIERVARGIAPEVFDENVVGYNRPHLVQARAFAKRNAKAALTTLRDAGLLRPY